ncbi:MAG TPA: response regulator [Gemmatimonadaceae bacterium]|nr:response regulator [Gemmatimonadaceae bacterium]
MTKTVLIVDDDDDIREVGQLALELGSEWSVLTANSGETALALAKSGKPDAILLDVMMPEMDGPTTLIQLRADPSTCDIPVVFLTARVRTTERSTLAALGVAGVLSKPFDPLKLPDQVAEVLGWVVAT